MTHLFKWNAETYVAFWTDVPDQNMILSGWDWSVKWVLPGILPIIVYKKALTK